MKKILFFICIFLVPVTVWLQTNPLIGIKDEKHMVVAFTHATIHISSSQTYSNATLVIKDERILDCGEKISIPSEAKVIDCTGKHIYPSFIETWSDYGLRTEEKDKGKQDPTALYWNDAIKTDFFACQHYTHQKEPAEKWRKFGIGAILTHRMDGIMRGSGTLVTLADVDAGKNMVKDHAAAFC
jgi:hypothetical protein